MRSEQPRILCVDDEPLNLSLLEAMLIPYGYAVTRAGSGLEALEILSQQSADLVLLDIMMPGVNGFEVCRQIKADPRLQGIPVVVITALNSKKDRVLGIECGAEDFITKPFDSEEVLARIRMLLKVKDMRDRLEAAYRSISKITSFGEQSLSHFNPLNFNFLEKIDSIVNLLFKREFKIDGCPELALVGFIDGARAYRWFLYNSGNPGGMRILLADDCMDPSTAFAEADGTITEYFNISDENASASRLFRQLGRIHSPVKNVIRYSSENFCLITLNYGRDVTRYDAEVLKNIVVQGLFLKSLALMVSATESAFDYMVFALARASEANDEDTGNHILRVGAYSALLARQMELPEKLVSAIRLQASLHDVGKIHISSSILRKPAVLTETDWDEMKKHTIHGARIIGGHFRMSTAGRIAFSHHERWDGTGYPKGLKEEQIPIEARIVCLADQYDALRNARVYKPAYSHQDSCKIITEGDGRTMPCHFDPRVLSVFKESMSAFESIYEECADN